MSKELEMFSRASRRHAYAGLTIWPALLILALCSAVATAQEQPVVETGETPSEQSPSPGNAGEALREIERLTSALQDNQRIEELRTRLEAAQERLRTVIEDRLGEYSIERIDQSRLDGLLLALSRQRSMLSDLSRDVGEAINNVGSVQESLRQAESTWTKLLAAAERDDLPKELVDLMEQVVVDAARGRKLASDRLGELVAIETGVLELGRRVASLGSAAEERARALLADILKRDAQPVWTVLSGLSADSAAADMAALTDTAQYGLTDLAGNYESRLFGHGIGALLVLMLVLGVGRSQALSSRIEEGAARRVLHRPIAVTVVLTLAFTQVLYPTAQPSVIALSSAAFIVAELVVLGAALRGVRWLPLSLTGAYLIAMRAIYLLPFAASLHRIGLLAGALGGIVLMAATWRLVHARVSRELWRAAVGAMLLVFAFLLATAVMANIVGAVTYSSFVVEAVVRSYLAALGLLTLGIVVRDLVGVLLDTRLVRPLRSVQTNRSFITQLLRKAIGVAAVIIWFWAALNAFRLFDPLLGAVQAALDASWTIGLVNISLGSILIFVLSVWLAVYVSRVTRFFLDEDVLPRLNLPRGVPAAMSTGVHYLIISAALIFGTAAAGLDLTKLAIVVGALSVGIGFGLQNIVNNFVSGLILLFERPIQIGDHVQVGQLMGRVTRIGIRASTVRTYEGSEVIVPNGDLISNQVVNYTLSDRDRRMELAVGVAYGTDVEKARGVIEEAVNSVPIVSQDPPSQALFRGFGDSSLDFRVLFWIDEFDQGMLATSEVGIAINRALKQAGIEIPFPQRDLHFRSGSPVEIRAADPGAAKQPD